MSGVGETVSLSLQADQSPTLRPRSRCHRDQPARVVPAAVLVAQVGGAQTPWPAIDAAKFAGTEAPHEEEGRSLDQSMLDLVMESASDLQGRVGIDDRRKLDEYLESVRSLEQRVAAIERSAGRVRARPAGQGRRAPRHEVSDPIEIALPAGEPASWQEHLRLMADLMILAFQTDITRVTTLAFSKPYGRSYPELGFSDNHHECSHHEHTDADKIAKLCKIERYNVEQLAYVIQRMKEPARGRQLAARQQHRAVWLGQYFIVRGTFLQDGKIDLAKGMVDNFFFEIEHYGSILNGKPQLLSKPLPAPIFDVMISESTKRRRPPAATTRNGSNSPTNTRKRPGNVGARAATSRATPDFPVTTISAICLRPKA